MIRIRFASAALALFLGSAALPAVADDPPARGAPAGSAAPDPTPPGAASQRRSSLDELFARLAASKDETEANGIAGLIERRFVRSGSDTADLLMTRAAEALEGKDAALAVELLDRVTQLKPDWAEAWHRRAAAFFLLDDPEDALADLHQALTREPRLFGAWMSLGQIRLQSGDKAGAVLAFRKALALHPFLGTAKTIVERLAPDIDGRDL